MEIDRENNIIEVKSLCKNYKMKADFLDAMQKKKSRVAHVLTNVDLDIRKNEVLGLVGESGCGKSTLARCILQLYPVDGGAVYYDGGNVTEILKEKKSQGRKWLREHFCKDVQMIFQDPYSSLNPKITVYRILEEVLLTHKICRKENVKSRIYELMELCGLDPGLAGRYPGEFSGGQRQRVGIARALALQPKVIIADEPVSALDVSIQAQILNLLNELKEKLNLTVLFISHDMHVVRHIADRVAIMYCGSILEIGETEKIFNNPKHPYTKMLLNSVPEVDPDAEAISDEVDIGELPSLFDLPEGCKFFKRCPAAIPVCNSKKPEFTDVEPGHECACFHS